MPVESTCLLCGKLIVHKPSRVRRYCSRACKWQARRRREEVTCETCGRTFVVNPYRAQRRRYCSQGCFGKANSPFLSEHNRRRPNPLWSVDDIAYLRARYPTDGVDAVAQALGKTSTQVHDKAQALKLYVTTGSRTRRSKLEKRMAGMFDELGVCVETSVFIKSHFIVDFRIGRLIVEADGDWWHGHPRYAPHTERQIAQQRRDAARNAYLTKCGYTVVRVWESDVSIDYLRRVLTDHAGALSAALSEAPSSGV